MEIDTIKSSRKLAAIVFSDVVDFTKIMSKDEALGLKFIKEHSKLVKDNIHQYQGELLKELGDGCLMIFSSTYDAVNFSKKLQEQISESKQFSIRIGIHVGDIIKENDDYFGSGVNIASRIYKFAKPGEICITNDVYNQVVSHKYINAQSIGDKKIKGIDNKYKIYKIVEEDTQEEQNKEDRNDNINKSLINELIARRVPQFIGVYGAIGWTIIQFVDWIINRYHYSPYLVDLALAVVLSMIPSVLILAYFHGAPGKDKWTKIEKVGIPANIIASMFVILILFYPKDLGAITKTINITGEDGSITQKVIPKAEFRKTLLIYNLNVDKLADYSWLSYGISEGLSYDLEQDIYMSTEKQDNYRYTLAEYNKDIFDVISLSLQREIADEMYMQYFLNGYITMNADIYEITLNIYETKGLKLLNTQRFKGKNIFNLIDEISIAIRRDLEVPENHILEMVDMPASELLTTSLNAFKNYVKGKWNTWTSKESVKYLEQSIQEDDEFAAAYMSLVFAYTSEGKGNKRVETLEKVIDLIYKLPEKSRMLPKAIYYFDTKQIDKGIIACQRHIENNPYDDSGYNLLGQLYTIQSNWMGAINIWGELVDLHRKNLEKNKDIADWLLNMGDVAMYHVGDYKLALKYYNEYLNIFPDEWRAYQYIGNLYERINDQEKAKKFYEEGLKVKPDNINLTLKLINIDEGLGVKRISQMEEILNKCKTFRDSSNVYLNLTSLTKQYGMVGSTIKNIEVALNLSKSHMAANSFINLKAGIILNNSLLGDFDNAYKLMIKYVDSLEYPGNLFVGQKVVELLIEHEKWQILKDYRPQMVKAVETLPMLIAKLNFIDGMLTEHIDHNFDKAIEFYDLFLNEEGYYNKADIYIAKARCNRKMKKYPNSTKILNTLLNTTAKYRHDAYYEYALLYKDTNDYEKASKYLELFLDHYKHADEGHIKVMKGKVLKEELVQYN